MNIILWILLAFLIFFVVVMIHEFGHFITARLTGMRVLEFGLWIPPKIKKIFTDKKWTNYTINALPIGGFVRIDWEDISSPSAFNEGNFMSKKWHKRFLVLVAGVVMNFILAFVIFTGLFWSWTKPFSVLPIDLGRTNSYFLPSFSEAIESGYVYSDWVFVSPLTGSIAEQSGLQKSDIILAVNDKDISNSSDLITEIEKNQELKLSVLRANPNNPDKQENLEIFVTPENWKIGSYVSDWYKINKDFSSQKNFGESIIAGARETYFSSILTLKLVSNTLGKFFFPNNDIEREEAKKSLSGPVGMTNATIKMIELSVPFETILLFTALLSVNLAVMNLLPFPALDGWRIIFTTIYSILHRFGIPKQKILITEWYIHTFGFLLLIIFMIYVAGLDFSRLFN